MIKEKKYEILSIEEKKEDIERLKKIQLEINARMPVARGWHRGTCPPFPRRARRGWAQVAHYLKQKRREGKKEYKETKSEKQKKVEKIHFINRSFFFKF